MTLRDAIREMVRWCQMNWKPEVLANWRDREQFRQDIDAVAARIHAGIIKQDSHRALHAAWTISSHFILDNYGEKKERWEGRWRTATRSVWVSL